MIGRFELFTRLITKISRNIRRIKATEMEQFELKTPHVACLYYIYMCKDITLKKLCDMSQEDKAAISRAVDYLVENGFIEEEKEPPRKYKSNIKLTDKGKEIGKYIVEQIDRILKVSAKGLSKEELAIFYRGLQTISNNLDEICNEYEN